MKRPYLAKCTRKCTHFPKLMCIPAPVSDLACSWSLMRSRGRKKRCETRRAAKTIETWPEVSLGETILRKPRELGSITHECRANVNRSMLLSDLQWIKRGSSKNSGWRTITEESRTLNKNKNYKSMTRKCSKRHALAKYCYLNGLQNARVCCWENAHASGKGDGLGESERDGWERKRGYTRERPLFTKEIEVRGIKFESWLRKCGSSLSLFRVLR